ncbi:MAG: branched-chain amino acid transaminase [Candidatus Pacearchaeota archaeon]
MEKTKFIFLNNKFVSWEEAKIHILSHALHYGSGAFEGIRCYKTEKGPAIFRLKEHVERMFKSFEIFEAEIPYSKEEVEKYIKETVKINNLEEGYIRPIIFFGYGEMGLKNLKNCEINLAIACWPWGSYLGDKPIKVKVSKIKRISPSSLKTEAKICGHYVNSILASLEIKKEGYDEAILLDDKENIAEGPGENIFIVKSEKIFTPKLGPILPGITRDSVIKISKDLGYEVIEKDISLEELFSCDEAFFTGTAAEVTPIGSINDKIIKKGEIGEITKKIRDNYLDIVKGKNKKYENWLVYIN